MTGYPDIIRRIKANGEGPPPPTAWYADMTPEAVVRYLAKPHIEPGDKPIPMDRALHALFQTVAAMLDGGAVR